MPRTALTVAILPVNTSTGLRVDTGANAADVANGNVFDGSLPFLFVRNVHATLARNITFTATKKGETVTKIRALVAGEVRLFRLDADLWGEHGSVDGGKIYVNGETADVQMLPFRRP